MLSQNHSSIKHSEIQSMNQYLSQQQIKRIYANLVYYLTLYQPNDPIEFMIQHLRHLQQQVKSPEDLLDMSQIPMKSRPRIIFMINSGFTKESLLAREVSLKYKFYYMQLNALIEKEIYSDSELGRALDEARNNPEAAYAENAKLEKSHKMDVLSKELELNVDHEDFVLDGFPGKLSEALWFEQDICEPRFILYVKEPREAHPELSDEEWASNERSLSHLKEYYNGRNKWIEIEGEREGRTLDEVLKEINEILV